MKAKRGRPKRPSYLIMVSSPRGLEVFSAHASEADAAAMHDRLGSMLAKTPGNVVHLVEVPNADGLVPPDKAPCRRIEPKDAVVVPMKPQSVQSPAPVSTAQNQAEFEEETRRLAKGKGPRDGHHDDKYVGAFS
jgi:hypothetical protein